MTAAGKSSVWYVARHDEQYGPISDAEFLTLQKEGSLLPDDLVWRDGQSEWLSFAAFQNSLPTPTTERTHFGSLVRIIKRALNPPKQFVTTAYRLVAQPEKFALTRIDQSGRDLQRSLWFFLNAFSIVAVVTGYFTYLQYYSGLSQPRELAAVAVQIVLALPLLYCAALATRKRIPFRGLTQTVLYVDAVYLLTMSAISISVAALTNEIGKREVDIFGSEYERCLASESTVYWVLRGDLSFFARPLWMGSEYLTLLKDNLMYLVVVPFCALFGQLLYKRYGTPRFIMAFVAALAFVAVVQAHERVTSLVTSAIANKSDCFVRSVQLAQGRYSRTVLAQQAAHTMNVQFSAWAGSARRVVHATPDGLFVRFLLRPEEIDDQAAAVGILNETRSLYCDERTNFRYAKLMKEVLTIELVDEQKRTLSKHRIAPRDCPAKG